jgi:acetylornithine aminotransferase
LLAAQLEAPVARDVAALALARGLLVNAVRPDAIRVAPPLLVSDAELGRALAVLGDVLAEALDATAGDAAAAGE